MKAQELPQVNVQNPQGKSVSSVSWIDHETPFVVSFWSTTCKPCLKELDALSENYDDWNDEKAFRVIAVSIDDSRSLARAKALAAKKAEAQLDSVKPYIDAVMTFEELQALYDSRDIDITTLGEDVLDNASFYGRIFARSGGLSDAVAQGLKEQNIEFCLKAIPCDGIEECRIALLKKQKNILDANFIEGMACIGGCIGGAGCLTHGEKNKAQVDEYGREAMEKTITDAVSILK